MNPMGNKSYHAIKAAVQAVNHSWLVMAGDGIEKELIKVTKHYQDRGYELRDELWSTGFTGYEDPTEMKSAYSLDGDYIGQPEAAYALWNKFGITKWEKRNPDSNVCSIGYSPDKGKWYGWSHRACNGFDSKQQAKRFAKSVAKAL